MNKGIRTVSFINLLFISLIFTGCQERSENHEDNRDQKEIFSIREGRRLFMHYCSPCHGENGDGFGQYLAYGLEPKPPDFTLPDFLEIRSDESLFLNISEGSYSLGKSNLCPPWGKTFRKEEIIFIADYVKYLNEKANSNNNHIELPDK